MIELVLEGKDKEEKYFCVEDYEKSRKNRRTDIIVRKTLEMLSQEAKQRNEQLDVAFYLRVSTKNKSQEMALKEQQRYMEKIEKNNKEWKVSWYIDFGKSGTNTNRQEFQKLLEDAKSHKFTYVVAREVARFARNVSQSLVLTDELRENYDIGAYFLFDEIDTLRMEDRSKFIDKAKQSEEEAWRTSKRVHATIDNQIEYDDDNKAFGPPRGSQPAFGYRTDRGNKQHWQMDERHVETVRKIFSLAEQGLTTRNIKFELEKQRIKNSKGKIDWYDSTINRILRNPVYIGFQYQGKDIILPEGFLEKKRTRTSKEDWILVDIRKYIPVIISEEQFYKVQELLDSRRSEFFIKEKLENIEAKEKDIWCALLLCNCGSSYRQDGGKNNKMQVYRCYNQINNGSLVSREKAGLSTTGACGIKSVAKWKLLLMFEKIVDLLLEDKETIINKAISFYKEYCVLKDTIKDDMNKIEKEIKNIKNKRKTLLSSFTDGYIEEDEYHSALKELKKKESALKQKLNQSEKSKTSINMLDKSIDVEKTLYAVLNDKNHNNTFIYSLVDLVVHQGDNKYLWFLNFNATINEEGIREEDRMIFIKKSGLFTKKIVKNRGTFFKSFTIGIEEARTYKYEYDLGYVKQWTDLEVEVYL